MDRPSITALFEHYGGEVYGTPGGWQKAKCCIHDDRTASASVAEDEGKWACFTCDEAGDAYDLIGIKENISDFRKQVEHARELGLESSEAGQTQRASGSLSKPVGHGGRGVSSGKRDNQGGLFKPPIRQGSSSLAR